MLLAVDVGNTLIKLGAFSGDALQGSWRLSTPAARTPDELGLTLELLFNHHLHLEKPLEGVVVSSVVPRLNESLHYAFSRYFDQQPVFLKWNSGVVHLEVDDPTTVGPDRIADCLAGHRLFGGPLLTVNFGTASTFNLVSKEGAFLGGAIAPEMSASFQALVRSTALLPEVELNLPSSVIGRNTADNLQAGMVLGFLALVDGLIGRFRQEFSQPLKVVATGGRGAFFKEHLNCIETYEPYLTLHGLRLAWEKLQGSGSKRPRKKP